MTLNPFYREIAGTIARTLIATAAGAGLLSDSETEQYAGALTVLLVGLWSAYQKYSTRQKLVTLAASPAPMSEKQAEVQIAQGKAASVTTPADHIPVATAPSAPASGLPPAA